MLGYTTCHLTLITIQYIFQIAASFSDISQGNVVTYLRCGGIFKYDFVASLRLSLSVKELKIG